jgi:hypothetical protein
MRHGPLYAPKCEPVRPSDGFLAKMARSAPKNAAQWASRDGGACGSATDVVRGQRPDQEGAAIDHGPGDSGTTMPAMDADEQMWSARRSGWVFLLLLLPYVLLILLGLELIHLPDPEQDGAELPLWRYLAQELIR